MIDLQMEVDHLKQEHSSLIQSIISACTRVGKDPEGRFPFNASDLADRILRLEGELRHARKRV